MNECEPLTPEMIAHCDLYSRYYAAQSPDTSVERLANLAEDKNEGIRWVVAHNPNTPRIVKLWLNNDGYAGMSLAEFMENIGAHE